MSGTSNTVSWATQPRTAASDTKVEQMGKRGRRRRPGGEAGEEEVR